MASSTFISGLNTNFAIQGNPGQTPSLFQPAIAAMGSAVGQITPNQPRGADAIGMISGQPPAKTRALLNGQRAAIANPSNAVVSPLVGNFGYTPGVPMPGEKKAPITPVIRGTDTEQPNARIPYNRHFTTLNALRKKPYGQDANRNWIDLPSHRGLALIKKQVASKHVIKLRANANYSPGSRTPMLGAGGSVHERMDSLCALNMGRTELITAQAGVALDPVAFNKEVGFYYKYLFETDPDRARRFSCEDFFYGDDEDAASGWSIDGACSQEEGDQGTPTSSNDGLTSLMFPTSGKMGKGKVMTVMGAGQHELLEYAKSRGQRQGGILWGAFTRMPLQENNGKLQYYTISHKSGPLEALPMNMPAMTLESDTPTAIQKRGGNYAAVIHSLRPPQLEFFYTPDGSRPDLSFTKCENEWGDISYDGLVFPIARVLFMPMYLDPQPPLVNGEDTRRVPCTNGYDILKANYFTAILFANKDGALENI